MLFKKQKEGKSGLGKLVKNVVLKFISSKTEFQDLDVIEVYGLAARFVRVNFAGKRQMTENGFLTRTWRGDLIDKLPTEEIIIEIDECVSHLAAISQHGGLGRQSNPILHFHQKGGGIEEIHFDSEEKLFYFAEVRKNFELEQLLTPPTS